MKPIERITVVGAGTMGHGIAQDFAVAGFQVTLHDLTTERVQVAVQQIRRNLEQQVGWELVTPAQAEQALACLQTTTSLDEAANSADLVVEAVFENLDLKRRVFGQLDRLCPPHTILGSNTSSYMPSLLAMTTNRPDRVLVVHYFYPPPLMPLVEIAPGPQTLPEVVEAVRDAVQAAGKTPVLVCKEAMGFIVNRLQMALLREAYHLVELGICSAQDVDLATRYSFGRRLAIVGPLELAEVQDGWDVQWEINRQIFPDLDTSSQPSPVIAERIKRDELGPRSGRGFYEWTPEGLATWQARLNAALAAFRRSEP